MTGSRARIGCSKEGRHLGGWTASKLQQATTTAIAEEPRQPRSQKLAPRKPHSFPLSSLLPLDLSRARAQAENYGSLDCFNNAGIRILDVGPCLFPSRHASCSVHFSYCALLPCTMNPANGRPLPPKAPSAGTAEGSERRSTGVRPRTEGADGASDTGTSQTPPSAGLPGSSSPVITERAIMSMAPASAIPLAEGIRNNSIAPESLRKPYASLAPQPKKTPTAPGGRSATGPRPQLESFHGMEDELSGVGQPHSSPALSSGKTNSGKTHSGQTKSTRAICSKHKIARGKNGECMLCRKEESSKSGGLGWKLMVAFIVLAVLVSGVIAAYVKLKPL